MQLQSIVGIGIFVLATALGVVVALHLHPISRLIAVERRDRMRAERRLRRCG